MNTTANTTHVVPAALAKSDRDTLLGWFTGASLAKAKSALDSIEASLKQGEWLPKASRAAKASLSKSPKAKKLAREVDHVLDLMRKEEESSTKEASTALREQIDLTHELYMVLQYDPGRAPRVQARILEVSMSTLHSRLRVLVVYAWPFVRAMAQVQRAIEFLDSVRPLPVVTNLGVSPTVTATCEMLKVRSSTLRMPELVHEMVERTVDGKVQRVYVTRIVWPQGTRFGMSPYYVSDSGNRQCQACGHAIKNPFNWLPVLADTHDGVPVGFWVGRDCAKNLFGLAIKGDYEFAQEVR